VERDFPWRVLEAPDEGTVAVPETRAAGVPLPGTRRAVAIGALGIAALLAAAVAAFLVLSGPRPGSLVIDGAAADAAGVSAAAGSSAPDAALVAGPGLVVDVAGAVLHPGVSAIRTHLPIDGDSERSAAIPGCIGCRLEARATKRARLFITDGAGLLSALPSIGRCARAERP
jgi:hypothetical protein